MTTDDCNSEVEKLKLRAEARAMRAQKPTFNPISNCITLYRGWNQPKPHPLTGDLIDPGERITWRIMGIYRRWTVFLLLQVLTVVWWLNPEWFPGGLVGWNLLWSDLAVMVEMIVGIAFMAQSMRDAKVIRAELKEIQAAHEETHEMLQNRAADFQMLREIHSALTPGGDQQLQIDHADGQSVLSMQPSTPSDDPIVSPDALPHDLPVAGGRGQPVEIRRRLVRRGHPDLVRRCATVAQTTKDTGEDRRPAEHGNTWRPHGPRDGSEQARREGRKCG